MVIYYHMISVGLRSPARGGGGWRNKQKTAVLTVVSPLYNHHKREPPWKSHVKLKVKERMRERRRKEKDQNGGGIEEQKEKIMEKQNRNGK